MFRWLLLTLLLLPLLAVAGPQERGTGSAGSVDESVAARSPGPLAPATLNAEPAALPAAYRELVRVATATADASTGSLRGASAAVGSGPDAAADAAAVIAHLRYYQALHRSRLNTPSTYANPPPLPVT